MSVRYAPSPTGRLHIGNLRTAWVARAFAKKLGMPWHVRFEDIDRPRVVEGAREGQLEDFRKLSLIPDRVIIQSRHLKRHTELMLAAQKAGALYPCGCSRKELQQALLEENAQSAPHGEAPIYNGRCRNPASRVRAAAGALWTNWRFKNPDSADGRLDFSVGRFNAETGEFQPSYHWACAIDDFDGDHRLLVRASDLRHVVPLQRRIHRWVARHCGVTKPYPAVFHAALVENDDGSRLEKRTRGITLPELEALGLAAEPLLKRFEAGFDADLLECYAPEAVWGEVPERITLQALL